MLFVWHFLDFIVTNKKMHFLAMLKNTSQGNGKSKLKIFKALTNLLSIIGFLIIDYLVKKYTFAKECLWVPLDTHQINW